MTREGQVATAQAMPHDSVNSSSADLFLVPPKDISFEVSASKRQTVSFRWSRLLPEIRVTPCNSPTLSPSGRVLSNTKYSAVATGPANPAIAHRVRETIRACCPLAYDHNIPDGLASNGKCSR